MNRVVKIADNIVFDNGMTLSSFQSKIEYLYKATEFYLLEKEKIDAAKYIGLSDSQISMLKLQEAFRSSDRMDFMGERVLVKGNFSFGEGLYNLYRVYAKIFMDKSIKKNLIDFLIFDKCMNKYCFEYKLSQYGSQETHYRFYLKMAEFTKHVIKEDIKRFEEY